MPTAKRGFEPKAIDEPAKEEAESVEEETEETAPKKKKKKNGEEVSFPPEVDDSVRGQHLAKLKEGGNGA